MKNTFWEGDDVCDGVMMISQYIISSVVKMVIWVFVMGSSRCIGHGDVWIICDEYFQMAKQLLRV